MLIAIYIAILFLVAIGTTSMAVYLWLFANQTSAKDFGMLIFGGSLWSWAAAISAVSSTTANAVFFGEYIRYTIIPLIPIMFLVFAIEFTGRYDWLHPRRMPPVALIPAITIFLNWMRNSHDFFIYDVIYEQVGAAMLRTSWTRGPWFWVHSGYTYGFVALSIILLIRHMLRSEDPYRKQTRVLIYGALIAFLAMIPTTLQLIPSGFSLMPVGGAIMALTFVRALFWLKIFNISPVARDVVFDSMEDLAIVLDRNSRITDINPVAEQVLGWKYDKVIGMPLVKVLTEEQVILVEDYAYSKEAYAEFAMEGNIYDMRISPLYNRRKRYVGRLIVFRDVTKRVELVGQLSESEERFRQLAENSRDIIWIWNLDRKVEFISPSYEYYTGETRERLYANASKVLRTVHPDDRATFFANLEEIMQGEHRKMNLRVRRKDGRIFRLEGWGVPIRNQEGQVVRCVGMWHDVTERAQLVSKLKEGEERFRQFAENTRDIVWIFAPDRKVEYLSPAFEHFTGISRESMYDSTFRILRILRPEDRPRFVAAVDGVIAGDFQKLAGTVIHKDGREFDFEGWGYPIKNEFGEVTRCIGVWRDMTERVRDETRLKKQVDELSVLHAIAAAGAEAADADDMIKKATEIISRVFPEDIFGLMMLDKSDGMLHEHPSYLRDRDQHHQELLILKIGDGISGKVAETGKPMIVPDVSKEPGYYLVNPDVRSELCVPLKIGQRVIGAMNLESFKLNSFNEEDQQLMLTIANQLATVIEKVRLFEEVQQLAITDSLTNLHNRRHFLDLARIEFERAQRYERPLSALMIDIDQFKQINDTHGHSAGDQVLQVLAERSCRELREADLIGRYGGDEFAILLPETDQEGAVQIAERLLKHFSDKKIKTYKDPVLITISIGVALISKKIGSLEALINQADEALYKSKADGGNSVSI